MVRKIGQLFLNGGGGGCYPLSTLPLFNFIWGTFLLQSKTVFDDFVNLTPEKQYLKTDTERTCLYFYKRLLMVNKNTSNLATLGELGRYPIQIMIIMRIIKFWYRINELEENSLLKETLIEQLRAQNTNKTNGLILSIRS